jgi:hypothetical protein
MQVLECFGGSREERISVAETTHPFSVAFFSFFCSTGAGRGELSSLFSDSGEEAERASD